MEQLNMLFSDDVAKVYKFTPESVKVLSSQFVRAFDKSNARQILLNTGMFDDKGIDKVFNAFLNLIERMNENLRVVEPKDDFYLSDILKTILHLFNMSDVEDTELNMGSFLVDIILNSVAIKYLSVIEIASPDTTHHSFEVERLIDGGNNGKAAQYKLGILPVIRRYSLPITLIFKNSDIYQKLLNIVVDYIDSTVMTQILLNMKVSETIESAKQFTDFSSLDLDKSGHKSLVDSLINCSYDEIINKAIYATGRVPTALLVDTNAALLFSLHSQFYSELFLRSGLETAGEKYNILLHHTGLIGYLQKGSTKLPVIKMKDLDDLVKDAKPQEPANGCYGVITSTFKHSCNDSASTALVFSDIPNLNEDTSAINHGTRIDGSFLVSADAVTIFPQSVQTVFIICNNNINPEKLDIYDRDRKDFIIDTEEKFINLLEMINYHIGTDSSTCHRQNAKDLIEFMANTLVASGNTHLELSFIDSFPDEEGTYYQLLDTNVAAEFKSVSVSTLFKSKLSDVIGFNNVMDFFDIMVPRLPEIVIPGLPTTLQDIIKQNQHSPYTIKFEKGLLNIKCKEDLKDNEK